MLGSKEWNPLRVEYCLPVGRKTVFIAGMWRLVCRDCWRVAESRPVRQMQNVVFTSQHWIFQLCQRVISKFELFVYRSQCFHFKLFSWCLGPRCRKIPPPMWKTDMLKTINCNMKRIELGDGIWGGGCWPDHILVWGLGASFYCSEPVF